MWQNSLIDKSAISGFLSYEFFRKECEVFFPHPPKRAATASSPGGQSGWSWFSNGECSSLTCGAAASLCRRGQGIASVHMWQRLRSHWNTNIHPPLRMPKPVMEMAVRRSLEKKNPLGGQLLGEASVSGQLSSLPGEAAPADRKDQPSPQSTRNSHTLAICTD